jgi:hypothetical protein
MLYNCDPIAPHSTITGIAESYKVEKNLQWSATFRDHCFGDCWVVDFGMRHLQLLLNNSGKQIDFRLWRCLIIKFGADATFTKHAPQKVYKAAEKRFFKFKGPRPFKIK